LTPPSSKPKNARVKRALEAREPKVVENEKSAIFVRGQNTSERVRDAMKDLVSMSESGREMWSGCLCRRKGRWRWTMDDGGIG
jgi:hypothetical protein